MNSPILRHRRRASWTKVYALRHCSVGFLARSLLNSAPGISQSLWPLALHQRYLCVVVEFACGPTTLLGAARMAVRANCRKPMSKTSLVSVVEDDRYFRDSMRRLMRSLGYNVETFSSAANFLASPRLIETTCLVADVHMPAMTGIELYKCPAAQRMVLTP